MKSITKILLYSLFLLALLSCQKEITHTIKVRVYNPATNTPYADANVVISENTNINNGPSTGTVTNLFYEGKTDANGELLLTKEYHKGYNYRLTVETKEYDFLEICYHNSPSFTIYYNSQSNPIQEINVELVPCAGFRYEINNVNCQGNDDLFQLFFLGTEIGYNSELNGSIYKEGTGCYSDSRPTFTQVPSGDWYFRKEITKNGVKEVTYDTLPLVAGSDYVYEINY